MSRFECYAVCHGCITILAPLLLETLQCRWTCLFHCHKSHRSILPSSNLLWFQWPQAGRPNQERETKTEDTTTPGSDCMCENDGSIWSDLRGSSNICIFIRNGLNFLKDKKRMSLKAFLDRGLQLGNWYRCRNPPWRLVYGSHGYSMIPCEICSPQKFTGRTWCGLSLTRFMPHLSV